MEWIESVGEEMKTAFLFTGQMRGFKNAYPSIKTNVESCFENVSYFFFGPPESDGTTFESIVPDANCQYENDNPSLADGWNSIGIGGGSDRASRNNGYNIKTLTEHYVMQIYNLYRGFQMIPNDFDLVVRIRPCCFSLDSLVIDKSELESLKDDEIFIPNWEGGNGVNDRFAIGTYKSMKIYTSLFTSDFIKNATVGAEPRLQLHLNEEGIKLKFIDWSFASISKDKAVRGIPGGRGSVGSQGHPQWDKFIREGNWIEGKGVYHD